MCWMDWWMRIKLHSESESYSVVSNFLRPHGLWNSPGHNTRVGSHSLSRRSSQPRDQTQASCIADGFFTRWATREDQEYWSGSPIPSPVDLWPQYSHLDFTIHQLVTLENYLTFLLGLPPAKTGELWAFITLLWHWDDFMPAKYFLKAFMWWMISNYTFYFIFSLRKHL